MTKKIKLRKELLEINKCLLLSSIICIVFWIVLNFIDTTGVYAFLIIPYICYLYCFCLIMLAMSIIKIVLERKNIVLVLLDFIMGLVSIFLLLKGYQWFCLISIIILLFIIICILWDKEKEQFYHEEREKRK